MRRELLIGCGESRENRIHPLIRWSNLTTLDHDVSCEPDVVHDLENLPLPFDDNTFDEIHAYQVLEHTGELGDWRFFFAQWSDFWRILKPDGLFYGTVPHWQSRWVWGDPSHKRVVTQDQFVFLDQAEYTKQVGRTGMSDFRHCYRADFKLVRSEQHPDYAQQDAGAYFFALQAIKPSRAS
jgi:SAM-dependent methyltransferase